MSYVFVNVNDEIRCGLQLVEHGVSAHGLIGKASATIKRGFFILLSFIMLFALAGCGAASPQGERESVSTEPQTQAEQALDTKPTGSETESQKPSPSVSEPKQGSNMENRILVVYFSATGTTKLLAEYAAEILNADLYEIVPEVPYTEADLDYHTNGRASQEQGDPSVRPAISKDVGDMEKYVTIVLGYPIWHGQAPRIISTFLESYDFSGKTIIPFCTSHSSGIGYSADSLHSLCSNQTKWEPGIRFEAGTEIETIREWLNGI